MIKILVGCSGSGKSTFAHKMWLENPLNTIIVSRDNIRYMFGYTEETIKDYYTRSDINTLEKTITKYEDTLISDSLDLGKTVIVDATHLRKEYITRFRQFNKPLEYIFFDIPFPALLENNNKRVRKVSEDVIKKQFNQMQNIKKESDIYYFEPVVWENSKNKKPCYVFDIDGTLAEKGSRNPYDWGKVGEDIPIESVVKVLNNLSKDLSCDVIICSGRDEICLQQSKDWFTKYIPNSNSFTFMFRKHKDMRPDWLVKQEMVKEICKTNYIVCWFDDRLQVSRHLRSLGVKVFNVEPNNF